MGIRGEKNTCNTLRTGKAAERTGKPQEGQEKLQEGQEKPQKGPQARRRKRVVPQAISFIAFGATLFSVHDFL